MSNFKKFVAFGMALTMVVGSSLTAFAAAGDEGEAVEATGTGTTAYTNMDIFSVELPTTAAITSALAYTVDPQGLVAEVEAAATGGKTVEEGAKVLFADTATTLSSHGGALTITNKSSVGLSIAIEAKIGDKVSTADGAAAATYAGGFSTTKDFSGTGDDTKGLYLGIQADNELEKALSTTAITITNVALSAADHYELTRTTTDGVDSYSYALKTETDAKYPEYSMVVNGALNEDVVDTTWYTVSGTTKTAKTMPYISVKYTPNGIKDVKPAVVAVDESTGTFYIGKKDATESDGGFGTTKPAAILINGKAYASGDAIADNTDGYVTVNWTNVLKAWGTTDQASEDDQNAIFAGVKNFKVTFGTGESAVSYYAEIAE